MSNVATLIGDQRIIGALDVSGGITGQNRSGITSDTSQSYELPTTDFRLWDAFQTLLTTAASTALGIGTGTFGTGLPYMTTGDVKASSTTRRARILFTLPPEFVTGGNIQTRFACGMLTTVSDTSATIDVEIYKSLRTTLKTGSDLITTAAQTINSLTFAEKVFDLSTGGLAAGDVLDIRVTITVVDSATGTAVTGAIAHAELLLDVKG